MSSAGKPGSVSVKNPKGVPTKTPALSEVTSCYAARELSVCCVFVERKRDDVGYLPIQSPADRRAIHSEINASEINLCLSSKNA